jgi:trigger factor
MQVFVEVTNGLERRLTVELPWDLFHKKETEELNKLQKRAKIAGFRPGKAPLDIVKRNAPDLRNNVMFELMREYTWNAIDTYNEDEKHEKLRLASQPRFEMPVLEADKPFKFSILFEVFPDIELKNLKGVEITKETASVTDADLQDTIEKLRLQLREWSAVERAAKNGDRVELDFEGFIDDQPFDGNSAKHFHLELGANRMIPGFEDAIVGIKANDDRTINVTFPAEYHAKELAGKAAKFNIHAHKVEEAHLPEVNEEFAKKFGIKSGSVDDLKKELRQGMERELEMTLQNKLKQTVFNKLVEFNAIEVPQALVDQESEEMRQQMEKRFRTKLDKAMAPALFGETSKQRIAIGLLVNEAIKQFDIKADAERVKQVVEKRASAFENPEEMISTFYSNKQMLNEIEAYVIEAQVVEKLLEDAKVVETPLSFTEVMGAKE